jgi:hypothetical protein
MRRGSYLKVPATTRTAHVGGRLLPAAQAGCGDRTVPSSPPKRAPPSSARWPGRSRDRGCLRSRSGPRCGRSSAAVLSVVPSRRRIEPANRAHDMPGGSRRNRRERAPERRYDEVGARPADMATRSTASPAGPPRTPASPWCATRSRAPALTPVGKRTASLRVPLTLPMPRQVRHVGEDGRKPYP